MRARLVSRYGGGGPSGGSQARLVTSKQGLWYELVPRMIRELNAGRPVHVTRLVDEAWAAAMAHTSGDKEAANDIMKAFASYMRPPPALSSTAAGEHDQDVVRRFDRFHSLVSRAYTPHFARTGTRVCSPKRPPTSPTRRTFPSFPHFLLPPPHPQCCDIAVRIAAARLRAVDPAWRIDIRVRNYARAQVEAMLSVLDDLTPCRAVYGAGCTGAAAAELGAAVDRPQEPVLCLQERRIHSKGHRGARRVRGGGKSLWGKLVSLLPYNPTWEGNFEPAHVRPSDMDTFVEDAVELTSMGDADFLRALGHLQRMHTEPGGVKLVFAPLPSAAAAMAAVAGAAAPAPGMPTVRADAVKAITMPYCVGCADKCLGGLIDDGESVEVAGAGAGAGAGKASAAPRPARGWLATKVSEVLGLAGGEDAAPAGVEGAVTGGGAKSARTSAGNGGSGSRGGSGGADQEVVLGLCAHCIDCVYGRSAGSSSM